MVYKIGILRETKPHERRTPLTPEAVKELLEKHNIRTILQPCKIRAFSDEEYEKAGGIIKEDLSDCPVIFGIKEVEIEDFIPEKAYMCFHHVIKGQESNMPMLKNAMEKKCSLLDYEKVIDENNQRLIFFGRHAGYAGMIDILHGFGLRLAYEGIDSPFKKIKQANAYFDLAEAKKALEEVSKDIADYSIPEELTPFVIGFLGYGNVSQGSQMILDYLPVKEISPDELPDLFNGTEKTNSHIYKVVFKEKHMVVPKNPEHPFELQDYYQHPEKYKGVFAEKYLQYLTILVNGAYWAPQYPRSITKKDLKDLYSQEKNPRLRFIGDISCDIEGGIESTTRISYIDRPFYCYNPDTEQVTDGVEGTGPVVLAIDHLPTEIPRDASLYFSDKLLPFIPAIAKADYNKPYKELELPPEILSSIIVWHGKLTPNYLYIKKFIS